MIEQSQVLGFFGSWRADPGYTEGGTDTIEVADRESDAKVVLYERLELVAGRMRCGLAVGNQPSLDRGKQLGGMAMAGILEGVGAFAPGAQPDAIGGGSTDQQPRRSCSLLLGGALIHLLNKARTGGA